MKMITSNFFKFEKNKKLSDSLKKISEKVKENICRSIKQKLIADVPCGVSLSGGIDSSVIAGVIKKNLISKIFNILV